jgi:hypothetical protein
MVSSGAELTADVTVAYAVTPAWQDAIGPQFAGPVVAQLAGPTGQRLGGQVLNVGSGAGDVPTSAESLATGSR